jgi:hypothetical protein
MVDYRMLDIPTSPAPPATFDVGTKVIVRIQYTHTWSAGFEVAGVVDDGYILGRLSDHHVLPDVFPFGDVRLERRRDPFRGISGSYQDRRYLS